MNDLFPINSVGIVTANDPILINSSKEQLIKNIATHYGIEPNQKLIGKIFYRIFDKNYIYYDANLVERARKKVMRNYIEPHNIGLKCKKGGIETLSPPIFITKNISVFRYWSRPGIQGGDYSLPLYLYPNDLLAETTRTPNLNMQIVEVIAQGLGLTFTPEKSTSVIPAQAGMHVDLKENQKMDSRLRRNDGVEMGKVKTFVPIDLLDYIYAVLHIPSYREIYKDFLKIDFPHVPYPKEAATFWQLVALGGELRNTHLLETPISKHPVHISSQGSAIKYPISGNNFVDKLKFEADRVYINETQYFEGVPEQAWNFYIGGYQPAQKWLKDRKGRILSYEDIAHYQKVIAALTNTHALMQVIDNVTIF